jgi:formylglycine-generating enzyme required for sulfatase activity
MMVLLASMLSWMMGMPQALAQGAAFEPRMIKVPSGRYEMGEEVGHHLSSNLPKHWVGFSYRFEIGRTEITQREWLAVMGSNPSRFSRCGLDCPVENVSWEDANLFIEALNHKTGKQYRLPSDAEWEYACRAGGVHSMYCGNGTNPDRLSWYRENSDDQPHAVAMRQPNAWQMYDMSGNVWEWVQDCWHDSYTGAPEDGSAWDEPGCNTRVIRGGSAYNKEIGLRAANRMDAPAVTQYSKLGFRIARTLP